MVGMTINFTGSRNSRGAQDCFDPLYFQRFQTQFQPRLRTSRWIIEKVGWSVDYLSRAAHLVILIGGSVLMSFTVWMLWVWGSVEHIKLIQKRNHNMVRLWLVYLTWSNVKGSHDSCIFGSVEIENRVRVKAEVWGSVKREMVKSAGENAMRCDHQLSLNQQGAWYCSWEQYGQCESIAFYLIKSLTMIQTGKMTERRQGSNGSRGQTPSRFSPKIWIFVFGPWICGELYVPVCSMSHLCRTLEMSWRRKQSVTS
jgi:hypothetical protein